MFSGSFGTIAEVAAPNSSPEHGAARYPSSTKPFSSRCDGLVARSVCVRCTMWRAISQQLQACRLTFSASASPTDFSKIFPMRPIRKIQYFLLSLLLFSDAPCGGVLCGTSPRVSRVFFNICSHARYSSSLGASFPGTPSMVKVCPFQR